MAGADPHADLDPGQEVEAPQSQEPETPEPPARSGILGQLPKFPTFQSQPRRPAPQPETGPDLIGPGARSDTAASSPASTDPPPSRSKSEEVVDLKDLQAAVREVSDIAFVGFGQVLGVAERRAKGLPQVDSKWTPTPAERKFVNEPAARIAKRHIKADVQALDTIDALLIAAGVGGFTLRRATGIDPLEEDK